VFSVVLTFSVDFLGGNAAVPLIDLIAMGQRLSLSTVQVVWQSLWWSKSVVKVLLEWVINLTVCRSLSKDF
jgi:hypothetical protein